MGYKINSLWTEIHKDDIMELNAIIDDEYCNELYIRGIDIYGNYED